MEGPMAFTRKVLAILLAVGVAMATLAPVVVAQTVVGVTATEIKIGNTNPYSGPASAYGTIGKVIGAYFKKVNDEGGVNGRKINYITYDDGYSPPKTVEMVRKLVEQDQVAALFQTLGTPPNSAIHKYMNRSEEHTSELQSLAYLVCRLLLEKKKRKKKTHGPAPLRRRAAGNRACDQAR